MRGWHVFRRHRGGWWIGGSTHGAVVLSGQRCTIITAQGTASRSGTQIDPVHLPSSCARRIGGKNV